MEILVFVSSHCPHCPKAVAIVKKVACQYSNHNLEYRKIRANTPEAKDISPNYNITAYPTTVFLNDDKEFLYKVTGVPSEENLKKKIDQFLGLKKSFWNKIFGS